MKGLPVVAAGAVLLAASMQTRPMGLLPPVPVPADNPQTEAKVALGAQLFFDTRLSADDTISCASCHDPVMAWANHNATDTGINGRKGHRNSGTILDAAFMKYQFWDGRASTLEQQALGPIENPVEMGETLANVARKLDAIPAYRDAFRRVFGTPVTTDGIAKAIAAFERTVVTGPSPYDRALKGESSLSADAANGLAIFEGKGRCWLCHSGPTFSDQSFHNIGVGVDREAADSGREAVTKDPSDRGRFKTPGLRNVALTWPYFHDGSAGTLDDVIEFYDEGGGPDPNLDPRVRPLKLTDDERRHLRAFLESLTGTMPTIVRPKVPGR